MPSSGLLIRPENTALVVVDFQEKLVPAIHGAGQVLANTQNLMRLAKLLHIPVVATTQYQKGLGPTVSEISKHLEAAPLDKICFGCMGDESFHARLAELLPEGGAVLLVGIEAHICVMQTALGALEAGYAVHVASDATGARTPANKEIGIERMRSAGAVISSTEMAIYELLHDSKREEFRAMLPHLR